MTDIDPVAAAIAGIPLLAGRSFDVERLGGLTNQVYRLRGEDGDFVLRIPGAGTAAYIDRAVEAHNARAAAAAGVSAEVLFADPAAGLLLTRHIPAVTMNAERFRDPGAAARAGDALRRLHRSGHTFQARFELFAKIDEYLALLRSKGAAIPDGYAEVQQTAEAVRRALLAAPAAIAPCHCDPLAENFLDTGERMVVVDWEYSGMNDPMWDLGDLSVEAGFGPAQDEALLAAYFGGPAPAAERGRMVIYKAMCDLLWTLWGVIQHVDGNPAEDFWAYATGRLARCRTLMADPAFRGHLAAIG